MSKASPRFRADLPEDLAARLNRILTVNESKTELSFRKTLPVLRRYQQLLSAFHVQSH